MLYGILVRAANPFMLLMMALGLALFWCWCLPDLRSNRRLNLAIFFYGLIYIYTLPITSYFLAGSLERSYPPLSERPDDVTAIVVLGGGVEPPTIPNEPPDAAVDSLLRCRMALRLYQSKDPVPIVVVGGNPEGVIGDPVAKVMARTLEKFGVASNDLIIEAESRDTFENAIEAGHLLKEKEFTRVVLVTSAVHLHRATHLFRKQGIEVIPAGCDYAGVPDQDLFAVMPNMRSAQINQQAFHEWLGIGKLWFQGRW